MGGKTHRPVSPLQQPLQLRGQEPPQPFGTAALWQSVGQSGWQRHWPPWQVFPGVQLELAEQLVGQLTETPLQ
jgi:hypothetical protein